MWRTGREWTGHLFNGSALNAVDAKGRLSVPAFIRPMIERRSDAKAIVIASIHDALCLIAYDRLRRQSSTAT